MPSSNEPSNQLPLSLSLEPSIAREDLIESDANLLAIDLVDHWPNWPSQFVIFAGPVGSGKTHMAKVWAEKANASIFSFDQLVEYASSIDFSQNLVLEDVTSKNIDEDILFHCFNAVKANGSFLVITSREFPNAWQLELADLKSRLRTAHIVELQEPDDILLSRILVKLFSDRQITVEPNLIEYLVTRMERSLGAAGEIVAWLDSEALARRSKINRSLAAKALAYFETLQSNSEGS